MEDKQIFSPFNGLLNFIGEVGEQRKLMQTLSKGGKMQITVMLTHNMVFKVYKNCFSVPVGATFFPSLSTFPL